MKSHTIRETFDNWWTLNEATGCHEWQRSLSAGYGQLYVGATRPKSAHRFAWERKHGPISDGLHVLHRCDNRRCVNVDHLFLGTNHDNIIDMHSKGRAKGAGLRAERHGCAKITWGIVHELRRLYAQGGISQRKLARQYGLSQAHVGHILRGESWWGDGSDPETHADYQPPVRPRRRTVRERFDELIRVDPSGCVIWTGWKNNEGYGRLRMPGCNRISAHRYSYIRAFGPIAEGLVVRHKCDRRDCVNPDHLFVGTQAQNIVDMVARGRQRGAVGENNSHAKLDSDSVRQIRALRSNGLTNRAIADQYGVTESLVAQINRFRIWREVPT